MEGTSFARKISFNLVALVILLIAIAMVVGFAAGRAMSVPSSPALSPASAKLEPPMFTQLQTPMASWVYHHDSLANKWYAYHFAITSTGPVIDEFYELQNGPGAASGCGLDRAEPDC